MWDERYQGADYMFGKEPSQALLRHQELLHQNGTTLAVADGEGRNSVWLASQGFNVHAMDSSMVGIEKAQRLAADRLDAGALANLTFAFGDIYDYEWEEQSYDNLVAIFIQFAPPEAWDKLFSGLKAALRTGGCLIVHGYTPEQIAYGTGGPSNGAHLYTKDMLADAFSDMDIIINEAYEAVLDEGPGHSGQSALIDFVAYKK